MYPEDFATTKKINNSNKKTWRYAPKLHVWHVSVQMSNQRGAQSEIKAALQNPFPHCSAYAKLWGRCKYSATPHFVGPPPGCQCLVVIRRLSRCSASLSRISSYTAGVFYWAGGDLLYSCFSPCFCNQAPRQWRVKAGGQNCSRTRTRGREQSEALIGGHYQRSWAFTR